MKRVILSVALFIFLSLGTTISFSYWDELFASRTNTNINIGVGATLEVFESIAPGGEFLLIPKGAFKGANDIDEVIYEYKVTLNKQGQLTVNSKNIRIDSSSEFAHMVLIDIYAQTVGENRQSTLNIELEENAQTQKYQADIIVRVTLVMPQNEEEYNAIYGKAISFTIEFKAEGILAE